MEEVGKILPWYGAGDVGGSPEQVVAEDRRSQQRWRAAAANPSFCVRAALLLCSCEQLRRRRDQTGMTWEWHWWVNTISFYGDS